MNLSAALKNYYVGSDSTSLFSTSPDCLSIFLTFSLLRFFLLAHCANACSLAVCVCECGTSGICYWKRAIKSTESTILLENLLLFQLQYNAYWHKFMLRQPTKSANLWFVLACSCSLYLFLFLAPSVLQSPSLSLDHFVLFYFIGSDTQKAASKKLCTHNAHSTQQRNILYDVALCCVFFPSFFRCKNHLFSNREVNKNNNHHQMKARKKKNTELRI